MYTGKMMDILTGLYYFGARFYDDATGRFITEDSVAGAEDDPSSLNRYIYANDNPMKFIDPSGHATVVDESADGSAVVIKLTSTSFTTSTSHAATTTTTTPSVTVNHIQTDNSGVTTASSATTNPTKQVLITNNRGGLH